MSCIAAIYQVFILVEVIQSPEQRKHRKSHDESKNISEVENGAGFTKVTAVVSSDLIRYAKKTARNQ